MAEKENVIIYHLKMIKAALIFMFVCNISLLALVIYIITHNIGE